MQSSRMRKNRSSKELYGVFLVVLLAVAVLSVSYIAFGQNSQDETDASQVDSTGSIIAYYDPPEIPAPEYEIGGAIIALIICLATFGIYQKRKK